MAMSKARTTVSGPRTVCSVPPARDGPELLLVFVRGVRLFLLWLAALETGATKPDQFNQVIFEGCPWREVGSSGRGQLRVPGLIENPAAYPANKNDRKA
jgi:hypothetical protein